MGVGAVVLQFEISYPWLSIALALQFPAGIAGRPWNINDTVTTMDASAIKAGRRMAIHFVPWPTPCVCLWAISCLTSRSYAASAALICTG